MLNLISWIIEISGFAREEFRTSHLSANTCQNSRAKSNKQCSQEKMNVPDLSKDCVHQDVINIQAHHKHTYGDLFKALYPNIDTKCYWGTSALTWACINSG